jgi:hypothetical protein
MPPADTNLAPPISTREDRTAVRAERHADAEGVRLLWHREGGDALDAVAGQDQGHRREQGGQHQPEAQSVAWTDGDEIGADRARGSWARLAPSVRLP